MTQTGSRMGQLSKSGSARAAGRTELGFPLLLSPGAPNSRSAFNGLGVDSSDPFYFGATAARLFTVDPCDCLVTTCNNVDSCALSTAFAARISSASSGAL
jgi:CO dehydrogenase/acetyl-CoA synthase alpha subunit